MRCCHWQCQKWACFWTSLSNSQHSPFSHSGFGTNLCYGVPIGKRIFSLQRRNFCILYYKLFHLTAFVGLYSLSVAAFFHPCVSVFVGRQINSPHCVTAKGKLRWLVHSTGPVAQSPAVRGELENATHSPLGTIVGLLYPMTSTFVNVDGF